MTKAQDKLEASKTDALTRIPNIIKARRSSIAFAAPELQDEKWKELEEQVLHAVREISIS